MGGVADSHDLVVFLATVVPPCSILAGPARRPGRAHGPPRKRNPGLLGTVRRPLSRVAAGVRSVTTGTDATLGPRLQLTGYSGSTGSSSTRRTVVVPSACISGLLSR